MNFGFLSTRIAGTDGVSLEVGKLVEILERMGHESCFMAGELEEQREGYHAPLLHFDHPDIKEVQSRAFKKGEGKSSLRKGMKLIIDKLEKEIENFVERFEVDVLFTQNVQSLPMHLPLGIALGNSIEKNSFPVVGHHHDFWWERDRFRSSSAEELLKEYFPPDLPSMKHLVINSIAKEELKIRKSINSTIFPNVLNFSGSIPGPDRFNEDLRTDLELNDNEVFFLQPTRVVPRKRIERSIELVSKLSNFSNRLFITHKAGDEGLSYLNELESRAAADGVELRYEADLFGSTRSSKPHKRYSLWDAYLYADFVTYPSEKEGFGNALLETVLFRVPAMVNRYPVYVKDIAPLGFQFVEISGEVTGETLEKTRKVLEEEELRSDMVEGNFDIALNNFSYRTAAEKLERIISSLKR